MPPICWHMVTASDAVSLVKDPLLKRYSGAFLLGSTAPDIRIMTNVPREETHFYDLSKEDAESGLSRMLAVSPHLARAEDLTEATRAFVSGYLTHLAVDEMWICQIYRPFFGKGSPLGGDPDADVLDRVLQFEMDLRERHNRELMDSIRSQIDESVAREGF
ncbi:MAG: zinc dependent phospholipase family protein [Dehalococcoidia bacterium]|nr:zinc dependent phospholipase family protein [Dehalococcoidia bacterium]